MPQCKRNGLDKCLPLAVLIVVAVVCVQIRPTAPKPSLAEQQRSTPEEENRPTEEQRQTEHEHLHASHRARRHVPAQREQSILICTRDPHTGRQRARSNFALAEHNLRNGIGAPLRC